MGFVLKRYPKCVLKIKSKLIGISVYILALTIFDRPVQAVPGQSDCVADEHCDGHGTHASRDRRKSTGNTLHLTSERTYRKKH